MHSDEEEDDMDKSNLKVCLVKDYRLPGNF